MSLAVRIPNALSVSRILMSPAILLAAGDSRLCLGLMLALGLTDILDGFLARRLGCVTRLGARLDSAGDLVLFLSLSAYFLIHQFDLLAANLPTIGAIALTRLASLLLCRIRNGKAYSLHTLANKAAGLIIFAGSGLIMVFRVKAALPLILAAAMASALEELLIMILRPAPDDNIKSVFSLLKRTT